ncbi:MAG TPA: hypothetical protein GXX51_00765 [Firmicutes bacterium]|nr:hypothetical protein [Bacillota bacterium]
MEESTGYPQCYPQPVYNLVYNWGYYIIISSGGKYGEPVNTMIADIFKVGKPGSVERKGGKKRWEKLCCGY